MKKIKMLKTACGPHGSFLEKREYTVSDELAKAYESAQACVIVGEEPKVEVATKVEEPKVEVATKVEEPKAKPAPKKAPAKFTPGKK